MCIGNPKAMIAALQDLDMMIGNEPAKRQMVNQIRSLLRYRSSDKKHGDIPMTNAMFCGKPGSGKTTMATKWAKILAALNQTTVKKEQSKNAMNDLDPAFTRQINEPSIAGDLVLWFSFILIFFSFLAIIWEYAKSGVAQVHRRTKSTYMTTVIICIFLGVMIFVMLLAYVFWAYYSRKSAIKPEETPVTQNIEAVKEMKSSSEDKDVIRIFTPRDFIGGYMGQTAIKSHNLLEKTRLAGQACFIDEFYSIFDTEQSTYGSEACATIIDYITKYPEFPVMIAGYRDKIVNGPFRLQPGLPSRFTLVFECDNFTDQDLLHIFELQVKTAKFSFAVEEEDKIRQFILDACPFFTEFGRSTKTALDKAKALFHQELDELNRDDDDVEDIEYVFNYRHIEDGVRQFIQDQAVKKCSGKKSSKEQNLMKMLSGQSTEEEEHFPPPETIKNEKLRMMIPLMM